jgi:predicted aldo/keto reductase-like oxidoreductase
MNPSLESTIKEVQRPGMYFIPMSVMAAGAIRPEQAFEFIGKFPEIKSVVVGMSRKDHIDQTVDLINKYLK